MTHMTSAPHLRILLADDNQANRLVAQALLEQFGHIVCLCEDGQDALVQLESNLFDLVLLDVMMPVLDGLRTLRQIRRRYAARHAMPIFALTAHTGIQDRQRYQLAGFDAIISKPLCQGDIETAWTRHHTQTKPADLVPSQVPISGNPPLLDDEVVAQLRMATSTARRASILSAYWESTEKLCQVMQATLPQALRGETLALTAFRQSVHTLKGASLSVGAYRIAEYARRLRNAPPTEIAAILHPLMKALLESRGSLSQAYSDTVLDIRAG